MTSSDFHKRALILEEIVDQANQATFSKSPTSWSPFLATIMQGIVCTKVGMHVSRDRKSTLLRDCMIGIATAALLAIEWSDGKDFDPSPEPQAEPEEPAKETVAPVRDESDEPTL
ncbi:hypothetical protein LOC67_23545 [Stieleria sp. JC731]|uniref:hypothetical protein n=1 Tax=Pirellulaceae TaxID=2691357 RepID=UPI001E44C8DA|nr:hypothetical protein [Stieleria sp. JC731]MCC9603535.1 hypothetical protein [Stieleria sp. JC731]